MTQKITYSVILVIFIFFNVLTFTSLRGLVAIFPRFSLFIGIVLCVMKLLSLSSPKIAKVLDPQGLLEGVRKRRDTPVVKDDRDINEGAIENDMLKEKDLSQVIAKQRVKMELLVFVWFFVFIIGIWLFGFYVATPFMIFIFTKIIGKRPLVISLLISGLLPVILYYAFRVALKIPLYEGIFFY